MITIDKFLQESENGVPDRIFKKLSGIRYDNETEDENYIIKTPDEVLKERTAICYDLVELQRKLLEENNYKTKTFFFYEKLPVSSNPTHTAIVFKEDSSYFWMEISWQSYKAIHGPFDSYWDSIDYIKKQLKNSSKWKSVNVLEYKKFDYENMNIRQFAETIIKIGINFKQ